MRLSLVILLALLSGCYVSTEYANNVKQFADLIVPSHIKYIQADDKLTVVEKEVIIKSVSEFHKMANELAK